MTREVAKLKEAGFIRLVKYQKWLANVVMVRKADAEWFMCVDFTNFNIACPKDSYPLPSVDHLVVKSLGATLLNFMISHAKYNQIHTYQRG